MTVLNANSGCSIRVVNVIGGSLCILLYMYIDNTWYGQNLVMKYCTITIYMDLM